MFDCVYAVFLIISFTLNILLFILLLNRKEEDMRFDSEAYRELFHSEDEQPVKRVVRKEIVNEEEEMISPSVNEDVEDIEEITDEEREE